MISAMIASAALSASPVTAFENGYWWNGETFESRTVHVQQGVFTDSPDGGPTGVVDLAGGYVVPPYCDAHAHSIGRSPEVPDIAAQYIRDGVFYVREIGNYPPYQATLEAALAETESPDLVFTGPPVTAPGGHPVEIYQRLQNYAGLFTEIEWEDMSGAAFFEISDDAALDAIWPDLVSANPAAIKVHLLYSEEYELRQDHPQTFGQRGLNPAVLSALIERADAAGIPVIAHVETAADFRTAISAGVSEIAHIPGYNGPSHAHLDRALTAADAQLAADAGVIVHTTLSFATRLESRAPDRYEAAREVQRENLRHLQNAGVRLVIGADNYADTSVGEVRYLAGLGVLDPENLLRMWTRNCVEAVFPGRAVGQLSPGFEASFLVLDGNPLDDASYTQEIRARWREGRALAE